MQHSHSPYSACTLPKKPVPVRLFSLLTKIGRYKWLLVLTALVFLLDQLSKLWILRALPLGAYYPPDAIVIVPDFFHIVHLGNTGAAWGMFQGMSHWLALLAGAALVAIFLFRRYLNLHLLPVQITFGLLSGGIAGNLIDRARHGYVVDFLDFHFGTFTWPAFNIADAGICVGVILYLAFAFLHPTALDENDENAENRP